MTSEERIIPKDQSQVDDNVSEVTLVNDHQRVFNFLDQYRSTIADKVYADDPYGVWKMKDILDELEKKLIEAFHPPGAVMIRNSKEWVEIENTFSSPTYIVHHYALQISTQETQIDIKVVVVEDQSQALKQIFLVYRLAEA